MPARKPGGVSGREGQFVPITQVVFGFGAEACRTRDHGIARIYKFLRGDKTCAMIAAHTLQIPFFKTDDQIIVLGIPVVKRGDVQAAI